MEAYDESGKSVWSVELDIYGRVRACIGEEGFVPFRYQGQYADSEIGLYYNRFRYYSPDDGGYTQQDPLKMICGISFAYITQYSKMPNLTIWDIENSQSLYSYVNDTLIKIDPLGLVSILREAGIIIEAFAGPSVGGIEHLPLHVHVKEGGKVVRVLMEDWIDNGRLKGLKGDIYPGENPLSKKARKLIKNNLDDLSEKSKKVFETGCK